MVDTRTVTLPAIWADDAITEIPTPPIANTTYRNTGLGSTELLQGWPYQKIVDSADFNQTLWLISNLVKNCEQYGIMPWCASTTDKQNGICLASNGIFYWAKKDNTGVNPVTDSGMTNWGVSVSYTHLNMIIKSFNPLHRAPYKGALLIAVTLQQINFVSVDLITLQSNGTTVGGLNTSLAGMVDSGRATATYVPEVNSSVLSDFKNSLFGG